MILQNILNDLPNDTTSHATRPESSGLGVGSDCQTLYTAPLTRPHSSGTLDCDVSNMYKYNKQVIHLSHQLLMMEAEKGSEMDT
jgi:hypothetical protein